MEKSDACVVQNQVLSQKEQTLKNTLYGRRGPPPQPQQLTQVHPQFFPIPQTQQQGGRTVPQAIVLPADSETQISRFLRDQDESMRQQVAYQSFPHQVLMQQAQTMQTQTSLMKEQQEHMLAHMNNTYNAQTVAHNQIRYRQEVNDDNRRILNEVIAPLKNAISCSQAQAERQEQKSQQTQLQLERLIEATNQDRILNEIVLKQQKGATDIVTSVALQRAGLSGVQQPRSVSELEQCSQGMQDIQNQIKQMSQQIVQLSHLADTNYTKLLEKKVMTQEMAMGGDIADSLKQRELRIEGLLGSVFDYIGFTDEMMDIEAERKRIAEEFYKIQKIESAQKEVMRRAWFDYEVPKIKLRKGRPKEVEIKAKKIPAHLRNLATVPQECPIQEYKPIKSSAATILDGSAAAATSSRSQVKKVSKKREERRVTREFEERDEREVVKSLRSSVQKVEEIKRESGPTQLLKLKRLVIQDIKKDIQERHEESVGASLPTVQFDETEQQALMFENKTKAQQPPAQGQSKNEILKKVREEMSQSFSQKHKEEEKLVDLLTDKVIEKMLTGDDLDASMTSTSGQLVKKLIRELEQKGVALDQFVKEEAPLQQSQQSVSYLSVQAPAPPKKELKPEQQVVVKQSSRTEPREEVKEDFMALISKKAMHQRKPQPRIDINLEDEKLKLEAQQELLRRQMPINAAPFVAQASNIGMSVYQNPFCIGAPSQLPKQPIHIGALDEYELSSADGLSEMWEEDDSLGAGIHIDNPRVIKARVQKQQMATIETNKRTIESEPLIDPQIQRPKVKMGDVMASTESFGPRKVVHRSTPHEPSNEEADLESGELPEHMFQRQ